MKPSQLAELLALPALPDYLKAVDLRLKAAGLSEAGALAGPLRSALKGGKRLRPVLTIASAAAVGAQITDKVIDAAAVAELVHVASLIHDDLIDNSHERRGRPALHARNGAAAAVLAGDFLLSRAAAEAAAVRPEATSLITETICKMVAGAAAESTSTSLQGPDSKKYLEIIHLKTGALMSAACQIGGLAAGAKDQQVESLGAFGDNFGMAFQLADDIADGDFSGSQRQTAARLAKRYSAQAAKALDRLDSGPVCVRLASLPAYYLGWALSAQNAII